MKIWKKYPTTQGCLILTFFALVFFVIIFVLGVMDFPLGFFIGAGIGLVVCFSLDVITNKRSRDKWKKKSKREGKV